MKNQVNFNVQPVNPSFDFSHFRNQSKSPEFTSSNFNQLSDLVKELSSRDEEIR
jgi:hypothetical protein